jgi:hypothetical protein
MSSEGNCHACGYPLGIAGTCAACALEKESFPLRGGTFPKCRQCGGSVVHSRLHGYHCAANREHTGIVWNERKEQK